MAIDRGHGIATSSVLADSYDLDALIADTEAAKVAAQLAETNAETAETNAETAETNAATSATASATSATASAASAASITGDAAAAAASATAAASSATAAATSKTGADTAQTAAETAETNAETAETNAETAEAAALVSKNAAATSATAAASSASGASTSASTATTQASTATTKASEASTSATNAATSATAAASSATSGATSASTATTKASEASTSATNAATSATAAATSATASATSATASAASAAAAAATKDSIDEFYLGAQSSDPTVDNNGDAVTAGDWYFNTSSNTTRIYTGSSWQVTVISTDSFLPKAGGTMTGDLIMDANEIHLADNGEIRLGNAADLVIYHDGSDSVIKDKGTGNLSVRTNGNFYLMNEAGTETIIRADVNGSVDLYYDNSKKIETTSAGIDVTGNVVFGANSNGLIEEDGAVVRYRNSGTGTIHLMSHDGNEDITLDASGFIQFEAAGSERMRIDSSGKLLIGDSASHTSDLLQIETPASGGGHGIQIRRNDSNTDQGVGHIQFGNNTATDLASISAKTDGATDNGALLFNTSVSGGANTERLRIDSSGNVGIGTSSPSYKLTLFENANNFLQIQQTGDSVVGSLIGRSSSKNLRIQNSENAATEFWTNNAERMRIDSSGNLLVGTTDTVPSNNGAGGDAGVAISPDGVFRAARSGNVSLDINRMDSDGDIVAFRKDGIEVGNIGVTSSGAYITLGGTAAANTLDDYEEGTWTMGVSFGGATTGITYNASYITGTYTKIGNRVTISGVCVLSNKGSATGDARVTGLPFSGLASATGATLMPFAAMNTTYTGIQYAESESNLTTIKLYEVTEAGTRTSMTNADFTNSSQFTIGGSYVV